MTVIIRVDPDYAWEISNFRFGELAERTEALLPEEADRTIVKSAGWFNGYDLTGLEPGQAARVAHALGEAAAAMADDLEDRASLPPSADTVARLRDLRSHLRLAYPLT